MSRLLRRFTLLLGAVLIQANCDSTERIAAPAETPQLQTAQSEPRLLNGALSGTPLEVQATIGPKGGWLVMPGEGVQRAPAAHTLWVPAGAVDRPTLFTIRTASDNYTIVELTAVQEIDGTLVDVGQRGFARPVLLGLSYAGVNGTPEGSLSLAYLPASGTPEEVPSSISPRTKTITAALTRASRYAICAD